MKIYFLLIISIIIFLFSCKKNISLPVRADFSVGGPIGGLSITYTDDSFIIGTHDELVFKNLSVNADSVQWNFGNGRLSSADNTIFSYDTPGNFTVTLTAFNENGIKSSFSIKITVLERVIKNISINNLQLNRFSPNQSGLPTFSKANLWIEVKFSQSLDAISAIGDIPAPVIYQSPSFLNVDSGFHSSLLYNLPPQNKVVINYPVHNSTFPFYPSTGRGTIVNLYAEDNMGTYLLASSYWGGLQILNGGNPVMSRGFGLQFSVPHSTNVIQLNCLYQ